MKTVVLLIVISILSTFIAQAILNVLDHIRYRKELLLKKHISDTFYKICDQAMVPVSHLSPAEKSFLAEIERTIKCKNFPVHNELTLKTILCQKIDGKQYKLHKIMTHIDKNIYCVDALSQLYDLVEWNFDQYIQSNKLDTTQVKQLNKEFFGKFENTEEEVLTCMLNMSTRKFISTFSFLIKTNQK